MAGGAIAALAVAAVGATQLAAQASDFSECVALLFYGSEPPTPESIFFIPLTWIALMLCPVLAVSFYPALDLQRRGRSACCERARGRGGSRAKRCGRRPWRRLSCSSTWLPPP